MGITKCTALMCCILLCSVSTACAQNDNYKLSRIRKELNTQDARLTTIEGAAGPLAGSPYGPGDYNRILSVDGVSREYEIHVPPTYRKERPCPVILNYHGGGGRAATARMQSGMDETSDREGFIAVYPNGSGRLGKRLLTWNAGNCCGYAMESRVDDVRFTRALLDDLEKLFSVDPNRVYATGLSNGAMMVYRLACEMSDRIAAVAPIAGAVGYENCKPGRKVSILHFHGTADRSLPYMGGVGEKSVSKTDFKSVDDSIAWWLRRNGMRSTPEKTERVGHATIVTYGGPDGVEVVLVKMDGMGHTWPGGRRMLPEKTTGGISTDVSANNMMWAFFMRHPLRGRGQ